MLLRRAARLGPFGGAMLFVSFVLTGVASANGKSGDLDPSFGKNGVVTQQIGSYGEANAVVIAPDGKVVVAGGTTPQNLGFILVRYESDGSPDNSFGANGVVTTPIGQWAFPGALALQPDGKIVVAGTSEGRFALARYKPDGALDSSFGVNGVVTTGARAYYGGAGAILLQGDGKIVVGGGIYNGSSDSAEFTLARYNPDGSLDSAFGDGGVVTTAFPAPSLYNDGIDALLLQPGGKLVAVGERTPICNPGSCPEGIAALMRYKLDGSLDSTFGDRGVVTTPGFLASAATLQSNGDVVTAGRRVTAKETVAAVARYTPDGSLDPDFGTRGVAALAKGELVADAVVLQPNRRIVVAGVGSVGGQPGFLIARFRSNGSLDPSFASGGFVTTSAHGLDRANSAALQPDGKIVAAGRGLDQTTGSIFFALARYAGGSNRQLRVLKRGPGRGTIRSRPSGVRCGHTCSGWFANGSRVTLTARPKRGSIVYWSGACSGSKHLCKVRMRSNRRVVIKFVRIDKATH